MIAELSDIEIEELLKDNVIGRIGYYDGLNTHIIPINYVYDGQFIFCHSQMGSKIQAMRESTHVCFQVDAIHNNTNWKSVLVWGVYQELTEERDRYYAINLFSKRSLYLKTSETGTGLKSDSQVRHFTSEGNHKSIIYRIVIFKKTGRHEND